MELFDSHAHLNDDMYLNDIEEVIEKCKIANISKILDVGYNQESSKKSIELSKKYNFIYSTVGLHPDNVYEEDLEFVRELSDNDKVVAIGEIGLDYHYEGYSREKQIEYFVKQIEIANEVKLPTCIHNRDADMDMLKILRENKIENGFIMHCFSSSLEIAKEIIKLGGFISIAGTVTFKNAKSILEVAKYVPLENLLVETDSPYLAPEPYRGKRNEPSYIIKTAEKLAEVKQISLEELAGITFLNAKAIFKL